MDVKDVVDVVVVGGGMFGSACARYLSSSVDQVVLVAPGEADCHGCWHDQGRLYRGLNHHGVWGPLADASIPRYAQLRKEAGINFYEDCGYLGVAGRRYLGYEEWAEMGNHLCRSGRAQRFTARNPPMPFLSFSEEADLFYQEPGSGGGYVNPRDMVAAYQAVAASQGCRIVRRAATSLRAAGGGWEVRLRGGQCVLAEKVVLCQGTNTKVAPLTRGILPEMVLTLTAQTLALMEVSTEETQRLAGMPSMVEQMNPVKYTYILPPIRYPDGRTYLKFGAHDTGRSLHTMEDVHRHYNEGPDPAHVQALVEEAKLLIPHLNIVRVKPSSCVTLNTPGKYAPYIDEVLPGVVVAAGGCGYGAKSCDEIGRIAARLSANQEWTSHLPKKYFKVKYRLKPNL